MHDRSVLLRSQECQKKTGAPEGEEALVVTWFDVEIPHQALQPLYKVVPACRYQRRSRADAL